MIRQRKKNLIVAGLVGALFMGILSGGGAIVLIKQNAKNQKEMKAQYEERIQEAERLLEEEQATKKSIIVSSKEIKAGVKLKEEDLTTIQILEKDAPKDVVFDTDDLVGKIVKIDIGQNTPLSSSMVFEEGATPNDLRSHEYSVMILPTKLQKGQFVDVRITFPTGEDFIVLSKKKVNDFSGTTVWYDVNESEILVMSSAIVDAYIHGAKLYAITYADPFMQDKAIPNYTANENVINLIQSNPNVVEKASEQLRKVARKALEKNLANMSEEDKMKVQNGGLILQQEVANNQIISQQNNQALTDSQQYQSPEVSTPVESNPADLSIGSQSTSEQPTSVPFDQIVQPAPNEVDLQKQKEIFEQPLVIE